MDDIGGKVYRELDLQSRISEFKRGLLTDTLIEGIFKTHQAMLAYCQSKMEYQTIQVERLPIANPVEEEKHPGSGGDGFGVGEGRGGDGDGGTRTSSSTTTE